MSTWLDDVQTALKNLGGEAHLSKIFDEAKRIRKKILYGLYRWGKNV